MKTTNNNTKLIELNEEELEYLCRRVIWDNRTRKNIGQEERKMILGVLEKIKSGYYSPYNKK